MTPGQAAYEQWAQLIPPSNRLHADLWNWATLADEAKAGWEQVAHAAIKCYNRNLEEVASEG